MYASVLEMQRQGPTVGQVCGYAAGVRLECWWEIWQDTGSRGEGRGFNGVSQGRRESWTLRN